MWKTHHEQIYIFNCIQLWALTRQALSWMPTAFILNRFLSLLYGSLTQEGLEDRLSFYKSSSSKITPQNLLTFCVSILTLLALPMLSLEKYSQIVVKAALIACIVSGLSMFSKTTAFDFSKQKECFFMCHLTCFNFRKRWIFGIYLLSTMAKEDWMLLIHAFGLMRAVNNCFRSIFGLALSFCIEWVSSRIWVYFKNWVLLQFRFVNDNFQWVWDWVWQLIKGSSFPQLRWNEE